MNWSQLESLSPRQAIEIQKKLCGKVIVRPLKISKIRFVAGADLSYEVARKNMSGSLVRKNSNTVYAGVVVLSFPELQTVEQKVVRVRVDFPYVPGLLSFRESPAILKAWKSVETSPDVLLVDGHGLAHPRRFGIACHLGLLLGIPTVGCGKSVLVGEFDEQKLPLRRGSYVYLRDGDETIGIALRTRDHVNPIFISVGHRSDLASARRLVLLCAPKFRIPEPTRRAHLLVNAARRGEMKTS